MILFKHGIVWIKRSKEFLSREYTNWKTLKYICPLGRKSYAILSQTRHTKTNIFKARESNLKTRSYDRSIYKLTDVIDSLLTLQFPQITFIEKNYKQKPSKIFMESNNVLDSASTDSMYSMVWDKESRSNSIKFIFHCK